METNNSNFPPGTGIDAYFQAITQTQQRVYQSQRPTLLKLAEKMADIILNRGRIYLFGTGHSHMLAEEGYARAGGLQSVVPIFYTALMLHESIPMEAKIERTPGLANDLLDRAGIRPGELLFIYSNSGVNHLPVEMALEAKNRKITTATIGSQSFAKVAPLSTLNRRLADICDYALDNGGIPGDGLIPIPGQEWKAGPSSTVIGAMLWNSLVVETCMRLQAAVGDAPIGVSFNMPGRERVKNRDNDSTFNLAPKHF